MAVFWIVLGALAFWVLQNKIYQKYWDKDMEAGLRFTENTLTQGDNGILEVWVENRKFLPIPALKVKFQVSRNLQFEDTKKVSIVTDQYYRNDVLSVRPYMRHARKLPFAAAKRGYYEVHSMDLVASNFFMSHEYPKTLSTYSQLYVYPRPYLDGTFLQTLQRINGEVLSKRHLLEDPFEYQGIREYSPFDTMRDINWKASARTGDLMVNVKGHTALKAVRIFLNLEDGALLRHMVLLELSIRMACGAAQLFLQEGIRTQLYTNGLDILTGKTSGLEAGAGAGHMETIQKILARIDLEQKAPSFTQTMEDAVFANNAQEVYTIFISADTQPDFQQMLIRCLQQKMDFVWICPRLAQTAERIEGILEKHVHFVDGEEFL
ncbi:MAG: DUF58 domain-containing protein [Lachnospiraceae bacterium]|nr:DUF58 domain-containing protein [Lachnospiraceae bacterium]